MMQDLSFLDRLAGLERPQSDRPGWTDHPRYPGVRLCRLVSGAESGNRFSTLLVSIEAGAGMLEHRHDGEVEQHLVLGGGGTLDLAGARRDYAPGSLAVIPQGVPHAVTAGRDGMVLMALFSPAMA